MKYSPLLKGIPKSRLLAIREELRERVNEAERKAVALANFPGLRELRNRDTGKFYSPHHNDELAWILDDSHKYLLAKGGEGGGKSVAGIVRTLLRVKAGCSGIIVSPDLPHFSRSLWPEMVRWIPWDYVVPKQRYRASIDWEPFRPFTLVFETGSILYCGGLQEIDAGKWEGPNVNFAHFDEARRHKTDAALKVLDGRVRIPGPNGEPPQLWITTTPRKHWLFEYFGPWETPEEPDPKSDFKSRTHTVTLLTEDNLENLDPGFIEDRSSLLSESEIRVLLRAEWEDVDDIDRFLQAIELWDRLREDVPPPARDEPIVVALDAGVSQDTFGMLAVARHPDPARREDSVVVRYARNWTPKPGQKIDFQGTEEEPGPEIELRRLIAERNVVQVCFDPYQLHDMSTRLNRENIAWFDEFSQGAERAEADKALSDMIHNKRVAHSGEQVLRSHINNADVKKDSEDRKLRLVKRSPSLKIDLAVCLSMGAARCLYLNL